MGTTRTSHDFRAGYVAIVGKPNVGKSTLMNNLLHYKLSIVTDKPQTTRHRILGILNGEGYQAVFLDTPGLIDPRYRLQEVMVEAAHRAIEDADVVVYMVEAASEPTTQDIAILKELQRYGKPIIVAINKIDKIKKAELLPMIDALKDYEGVEAIVPISALKADGLDRLSEEIIQRLPTGPPFYPQDQLTDLPERFLVSEIIREKIFMRYGEEIPYSTTVTIEEFREQDDGKDYIRASIWVEKDSQKGIIIGKKGAALREVGKLAREEIEFLLGRPVFLELWVGVKEKWRRDEAALRRFGYRP
jgi:GTP-binding protein Era